MSSPTAVDLFSGGGGLSLGLKAAGFNVVAAVESDPHAASTFALNNPRAKTISGDIRDVSPWQLRKDLGKRVALLAACPPCQGFTSLTSKFRRDDPRNDLPSEVLRFARVLKPKAIMFENVPRFATSDNGKRRFDVVVAELRAMGYEVTWSILQAADFGTAQLRRRLVVFASDREIAAPMKTHSRDVEQGTLPWRTVQDAIGRLGDADSFQTRKLSGKRRISDWHVTRHLTDLNLRRLKAAKPGGARWDLPDDLRPPCHVGSSSGFKNVYGRMVWGAPSPTITGGCTSPSKGRFGHPEFDRTITVREAARLQDFPDDYLIDADGHIDVACNIIGNAFPSKLAAAAAGQLLSVV